MKTERFKNERNLKNRQKSDTIQNIVNNQRKHSGNEKFTK